MNLHSGSRYFIHSSYVSFLSSSKLSTSTLSRKQQLTHLLPRLPWDSTHWTWVTYSRCPWLTKVTGSTETSPSFKRTFTSLSSSSSSSSSTNSSIPLHTIEAKFYEYFKNNDPTGLLKYAERCKPSSRGTLVPSYDMYHGVLWALSEAGMPESCLNVLEEMGSHRDIHAWNFYIRACGNNRDAERLRQVVHHLEFEKIPWNQQTYAKLIFAYLQCAEFDRALYWYHQFKLFSTSVLPFSEFMKLLLFGLKFNRVHELKELYTDLSLYNDIDVKDGFELLRALVDANQFEYAKECYAKLTTSMEGPSQHYVDMGLLNQFLELAGRKGDSTFVSDLLVHMCSTPYLPISLHHCACLLQALSFRHDYISLFQLLPSIRSLGHSPHESLHQLLPPFPSTSKWYGCQQWVSSQTSVDPSTWTVLIQGAFELGLHAQGLDLFSSLCTSVGLLRLELPTCHAALLCTQGQPPASRQHIFKTMLHHQRSFSTTTYLLLIDLATTLVEAWERYQFAKQQLQLHPCHGSTLMPPLFETMVTHYFKDPPLHSMEEMDRYWQELCMDFEVYGENTSLSLELKTLLASKDYHRVVEHQRVLETTHPPKKKEERLLLKKWSHAKDLFQFHPILHDSQSRLVREV